MAEPIKMPELGESITEGTITRWLKQEGDQVQADEPLFEVSTDKVDTEVPSPVAGRITSIKVHEDETVAVGTELAEIEPAGAKGSAAGDGQAAAAPAEAEAPAQTPAEAAEAAGAEAEAGGQEPAVAEVAEEPAAPGGSPRSRSRRTRPWASAPSWSRSPPAPVAAGRHGSRCRRRPSGPRRPRRRTAGSRRRRRRNPPPRPRPAPVRPRRRRATAAERAPCPRGWWCRRWCGGSPGSTASTSARSAAAAPAAACAARTSRPSWSGAARSRPRPAPRPRP